MVSRVSYRLQTDLESPQAAGPEMREQSHFGNWPSSELEADRDVGPAPGSDAAAPARPSAREGEIEAKTTPQRGAEQSGRGPRLARLRPHRWALAALFMLVAVGGLIWWLQARQFESTDDAYIDARTVPIAPQVAGAIVDVAVNDNQSVDADVTLIQIDDRDYRAQLDQALAQVEQAQGGVANLDAQIDAQQAKIDQANQEVAQAQAALTYAQQENDRYQQLLQRGATTVQQAQQTASDLQQKQAAFRAAQANAIAAQKQIEVLRAQRQVAVGQLDGARAAQKQAEANLARTVITAPTAGRVTKLSAAKGAYAQVGQALTMFVPREVWVTANFKETQLTSMRPGQEVQITVDAYPGRSFRGHVDGIQAGSGTAFSLLPAENATGNFVKVVQRVPVKIVFDDPTDVLLGPGMSVVPSVKLK
jgi:membrane fusion protein (multidrug efflux system)